MRYYSIMTKQAGQVQLLKNGFSYPAFFFTYFWALYHKLWLPWLVAFSLQCVVPIIMAHYFPVISKSLTFGLFSVLMAFAVRSYFGFFGNAILRHKAELDGYTLEMDLIAARNSNDAILSVMRFTSNNEFALDDHVTKTSTPPAYEHNYANQKIFWTRWVWGALLCLFVVIFDSYNLEFSTQNNSLSSIPVSVINQSNLKLV